MCDFFLLWLVAGGVIGLEHNGIRIDWMLLFWPTNTFIASIEHSQRARVALKVGRVYLAFSRN